MVYDRSDDGSDPYHLQKSIEQPTGDFKYQFSTSSLKSFERDILETVHEQKPSVIGVDRRVSRECCALPQSFQSKSLSNKIPTKKFSKAKVQRTARKHGLHIAAALGHAAACFQHSNTLRCYDFSSFS